MYKSFADYRYFFITYYIDDPGIFYTAVKLPSTWYLPGIINRLYHTFAPKCAFSIYKDIPAVCCYVE